MDTTFILGCIGAALFFIALFIIIVRNGIIEGKNLVKRNYADIVARERQKVKLIPELIKLAQDYQSSESTTFEKVVGLRTSAITSLDKASSTNDPAHLQLAQQQIKEATSLIRATAEAYPDLKTASLYQKAMKELAEIEENVTASITILNGGIQEFNDSIQTFPGSLVNGWFNNEKPFTEFSHAEAKTGLGFNLEQQ